MRSSDIPPMTIHAWLRYDVFRRLVPTSVQSILEIGAGQGSVGSLLARSFHYVGLEPDRESFAAAATRIGDTGTVHPIQEQDFTSEDSFDVVCAFEVLEHVEDDRGALVAWQRHCERGGWPLCERSSGS